MTFSEHARLIPLDTFLRVYTVYRTPQSTQIDFSLSPPSLWIAYPIAAVAVDVFALVHLFQIGDNDDYRDDVAILRYINRSIDSKDVCSRPTTIDF